MHKEFDYIASLLLCLRFQPSDEEKEMYKNYKDDKGKLQNADRFLMKVVYYTHTMQ